MGWQTPAWLWLLLPWATLVVVTLRAYRPTRTVPFVDLWPRDEARDDRRRAWKPPSLPILLLLLALLGGILALSGPWLRSSRPRIGRLTVILDRGVTMLAGGRFEQAATLFREAAAPLLEPGAQITVVDPLQGNVLVGPTGLTEALSRPATAMNLRSRLASAIERARREESALVAVSDWSDLPEGVAAARPAARVQNVGIVRAAANAGRCRLRLRNDSDLERAMIRIHAGDAAQQQDLELPRRGGERDYEIACPETLPIRVEVAVEDDLVDDNTWWLLPDRVSARLHVSAGAPEWLRRFASSYAAARPAGELSREVEITTEQAVAARAVSIGVGDQRLTFSAGGLVLDHAILQNVDLPQEILAGRPLPAGDWQVILESGGVPLLALADRARSVWFGFRPLGGMTPEYLILLTNAVEFCSGVECASDEPEMLDEAWRGIEGPAQKALLPGTRSGLYRDGDRYHAANVPAPEFGAFAASQAVSEQLQSIAENDSRIRLSPWMWLACGGLLLAAANAMGPGRSRAPAVTT